MDFDRWFAQQKPHVQRGTRTIKRLNEEARHDRADFEAGDAEYGGISLADRGCICFTGCAPCSFCMHPGNPLNQEVDECWEEVQVHEDYEDEYETIEVR